MEKRKLKINAVDVLLILLALAAAFVVLYIFVLSDKDDVEADKCKIQYVVEVVNVDSSFSGSVLKDQPVQDAVERKNIGTVVGVGEFPYKKVTFDYENAREVVTEVKDRITMRITIKADASSTDQAYTVDNAVIRVGKQYSLLLPSFYGVGYCIELTDVTPRSEP